MACHNLTITTPRGINQLTWVMALSLADKGIRVNAVAFRHHALNKLAAKWC
jgi:NAD(P)-dependent dehydrogenase (short-subunit alcohol dehydrogenase family)